MSKRAVVTYDTVKTQSLISTSAVFDRISAMEIIVLDNAEFNGNVEVAGVISAPGALFNIVKTDVLLAGEIVYPVEVVEPEPDGPSIILLTNSTSGYIIDGNNEASQYVIVLDEDVQPGNRWEVYLNSTDPIQFMNESGKTIISSGFVYTGDTAAYEYVPPVEVPPDAEIPQPGNKALYIVTVTDVTEETIRIVFRSIFLNQ